MTFDFDYDIIITEQRYTNIKKESEVLQMFNHVGDTFEARKVMESINMDDANKYADALLKLKEWCWECDPILIEEFWSDEVSDFLNYLASKA